MFGRVDFSAVSLKPHFKGGVYEQINLAFGISVDFAGRWLYSHASDRGGLRAGAGVRGSAIVRANGRTRVFDSARLATACGRNALGAAGDDNARNIE